MYDQFYNAHQGAIVVDTIQSPLAINNGRKERGQPPLLLPDLQRWSDVSWIVWAHQCQAAGRDPNNLEWILHHSMITLETQNVIDRVFKNTGKKLAFWPGDEFDVKTPEGQALLGTPHGSMIALRSPSVLC